MTLYGIKNCDTVQKAVKWLTKNKIDFTFHDFRESGITKEKLNAWCTQNGWETVLNKKSTTWRELGPEKQAMITTQAKAVALMAEYTSSIKRPVIEIKGKVAMQGFNEDLYKKLFL